MKLPIPFLLYVASTGLFGLAGWTLYEMLPLLKQDKRSEATKGGGDLARDLVTKGNGRIADSPVWDYSARTAVWWAEFKGPNYLGKPPPAPPKVEDPEATKPPVVVDQRPLDQIIELVALFYDGAQQGRGGDTHVVVRYKDPTVQPPEWYVRESVQAPSGAPVGTARDTVARPTAPARPTPARPAPPTPMPTSMVGREIVQRVSTTETGDSRQSLTLWPPFQDIRLVGVSADAQVAYFVRGTPEPGKEPPKEEDLYKTAMNLPQDVLAEVRRLQGRPVEPRSAGPTASAAPGTWTDVEDTTEIRGVRHIGRKDAKLFNENPDEVLGRVSVDVWRSSQSSGRRGLIVLGVEPQMASRFGVQANDVLLEINGRPVSNKAEAINFGKKEYQKGVRTFVTKWYSNGAEVERVYQAPDR